jgi:hypothetical protein
MHIFRVERSFNLILPNIIGALLALRKRSLEAKHSTPLTCLSKQCMHIANAKQIVACIMVKTPCLPLCHRPNKGATSIPDSRKSLISTYLISPNPFFHLMQKLCYQTAVGQTSGASKKTLPSGPYSNRLFTMVS